MHAGPLASAPMTDEPRLVAGIDSSTQSCKVVVCDADSGELTALFGSSDHLELAVNGGSAAAALAAGRGARVRVARTA